MTPHRAVRLVILVAATAVGAWFLYDPPWVDATTIGLRDGDVDSSGTPFRWTTGHAAFYVPREARTMTLRLNPGEKLGPGDSTVVVRVRVDDRPAIAILLGTRSTWQTQVIALPATPTRRRTRRVDLRVSRTIGELNLGVQLGDVMSH